MANKYLFALLGFTVIMQLGCASPVPDDSKSSEEKEGPERKLIEFAIVELNKVTADIVPKEAEVLKEVLNDLKADEKRTEADDKTIKDIEEFLKEADEAKDNDKKEPSKAIQLWFKTIAIIDPQDEPGKPSKKNPKIHDLLEKHGWKKVRDDFDAQIVPKIDELGNKAKTYYNDLSESEKKDKAEFGKWVEKFDDKENDAGDKINLLFEMFFTKDSEESKEN